MLINDYTMKTIKYSLSLGLLLSLASCADDQIVDFKTEKPESIAQYEYLFGWFGGFFAIFRIA